MTTTNISNSDDVIDSRDIIARLEELTEDRDALQEDINDKQQELANLNADADNDERTEALDALDEARSNLDNWEDKQEFEILSKVAEQGEGYGDWSYGETLINEDYFEKYCIELVKDMGGMPKDIPSYIENNINWEGVAEDLKADYTEIDFDGTSYFMRA